MAQMFERNQVCASSQPLLLGKVARLRDLCSSAMIMTRPVKQWAISLLRISALLATGGAEFFWCAITARGLIQLDRQATDTGLGLPVDCTATLLSCIGPLGWVTFMGISCLTFLMVTPVRRWHWTFRAVTVAMPMLLLIYFVTNVYDVRAAVLPALTTIFLSEMVVAMLLAISCRPIFSLLLPNFRIN